MITRTVMQKAKQANMANSLTVWIEDFSNSGLNTLTGRVTGLHACKRYTFPQLTAQTCPAKRRGFFRSSTEQFWSNTHIAATRKTGPNIGSKGKTRITRILFWTLLSQQHENSFHITWRPFSNTQIISSSSS